MGHGNGQPGGSSRLGPATVFVDGCLTSGSGNRCRHPRGRAGRIVLPGLAYVDGVVMEFPLCCDIADLAVPVAVLPGIVFPAAIGIVDPTVVPASAGDDPVILPVEVGIEPTADANAGAIPDARGRFDDHPRVDGSVNDLGIVSGHIDDGGIGGEDLQVVAGPNDLLLGRGGQGADVLGFEAETLDRFHDVGLLIDEGCAQGLGPVGVLGQHGQYGGVMDKGLDGGIPILGVDGCVVGIGVCLQPSLGVDDFLGIAGCGQDLGEEGVGKEGDGASELVELGVGQADRDLGGDDGGCWRCGIGGILDLAVGIADGGIAARDAEALPAGGQCSEVE